MNLQVHIIIHGVPAGQKLLGAENDRDTRYIQTLYNKSEWDVTEFMKVERVADCVYYSFIKCGNVCAHDGRKGSYFGITMRMNVFYADIQNIYSILQATYKKLCVGVFVRDNGKTIQFLTSDFNTLGNKYTEISKMTLDALGSFTSQIDLQQVGQIANTGGAATPQNLLACSESVASQTLASTGCLKVSPYYPSPEVIQLKSDYAHKLDQAQRNHSAEVQQLKASYESSIQQMKQQQEQQEREFQGGKKGLTEQIRLLEQQINDVKIDAKRRINSLGSQLREQESEKRGILNALHEIVGKYATPGKQPLPPKPTGDKPQAPKSNPPKPDSHFYRILSLVILLLLVGGFSFAWMQGRNMEKRNAQQERQIGVMMTMLKSLSATTDYQLASNQDKNLKIDIEGLKKGKIKRGTSIDVALLDDKRSPANLRGEWKVAPQDALEITDSRNPKTSMWLREDFSGDMLTILFEANGRKITERTLQVK